MINLPWRLCQELSDSVQMYNLAMSVDPNIAHHMFADDLRSYDLYGCSCVDYITKITDD